MKTKLPGKGRNPMRSSAMDRLLPPGAFLRLGGIVL